MVMLNQLSTNSQKSNRTLFSFGIESLFADRDLGGFYAILGYAYKLNSNSLDVCFHRVHQIPSRLAPRYHKGIPSKHTLYTPQNAVAFGESAGRLFTFHYERYVNDHFP